MYLEKFIVERHPDRIQYMFSNGFGASVVCNEFSYGGSQGLKELAVLDYNRDITYDTPITNDVIGYLSDSAVNHYLKQIKALNKM